MSGQFWAVESQYNGKWHLASLPRPDGLVPQPTPLAVFGSIDEASQWAKWRYAGTIIKWRVRPGRLSGR